MRGRGDGELLLSAKKACIQQESLDYEIVITSKARDLLFAPTGRKADSSLRS
jgi:hypothetical protein